MKQSRNMQAMRSGSYMLIPELGVLDNVAPGKRDVCR